MISHSLNRRDFLRATAAGAVAVSAGRAESGSFSPSFTRACILVNMVGGPAHLDTFDPKPNAPSDYRGPFRPIPTRTPGVYFSELFPKLAGMSDKLSLIRSLHHTAPPIHEAGFQLLNTGRLFRDGPEWPSIGAVLTHFARERGDFPSWWHFSDGAIQTGIAISPGQGCGFLDIPMQYPIAPDMRDVSFAHACQSAVTAVASGALMVTLNQFTTVFDSPSWDCHADGGSLRTDLNDIRNIVAPSFDLAFSSLLSDLEERGLLDTTLVVATGEFGRTPKLNANGGRDHWAGCWSALVAGGGVKGGRVIGASDSLGLEPTERPVTPQELVASVFHALGVPANATIPGPDGTPVAVYPAMPVAELF